MESFIILIKGVKSRSDQNFQQLEKSSKMKNI